LPAGGFGIMLRMCGIQREYTDKIGY